MKMYWELEVQLHAFLTLALYWGEWSASHPGQYTPGTHWIGGLVGPRAGLDAMAKRNKSPLLLGIEPWSSSS
jgi:hypothetical protein